MKQTGKLHIEIPAEVTQILETLHAHGYEAYVVGGCVRDALLCRVPGDWDITTSALPQQVKALFPHTVDTGIRHGTVMVLKNGEGYEVTTYRIDGVYEDGRHPKNVTFTRSLEEDLKRRDFTINAFAWGQEGLIDLFHGLDDLDSGVIRCVGNPDQRFQEDALRIMRAVRFSAQLGFSIEEQTGQMIRKHGPRLKDVSMERIRVEWEKTLISDHPVYVNEYKKYGLAQAIIRPGSEACFTEKQDALLLELNRRRKQGADDTGFYRRLMMAAFFRGLTPEETDQAMRYLKYDNRTREAVVKIIRYQHADMEPDRVQIKLQMNRMGEETWRAVLELKDADACSRSDRNPDPASGRKQELDRVRSLTADILKKGEPFLVSQLAVNGSDLIKAGFPAGKKLGEILENILQKVIQSPTLNRKELLCDYAVQNFKKGR